MVAGLARSLASNQPDVAELPEPASGEHGLQRPPGLRMPAGLLPSALSGGAAARSAAVGQQRLQGSAAAVGQLGVAVRSMPALVPFEVLGLCLEMLEDANLALAGPPEVLPPDSPSPVLEALTLAV